MSTKETKVQVDRKENEIMVYSNTYLMARYFMKDELIEDVDVDFYVEKIKVSMIKVLKVARKDLDSIYDAMLIIKANGIKQITESSQFYVEYDEKFHKFRPRFKIEDGFFELFKMKYRMLYLDYKSFDRVKLIEMLKFFRYINDGVEDIDDAMIDSVLNLKDLYKNLVPIEAVESQYEYDNKLLAHVVSGQSTMVQSFQALADNKAGVQAELEGIYTNNYNNTLQKVKLTLSGKQGEGEFEIFVPLKLLGVYDLGLNKFIQVNLVEDYIRQAYTNKLRRFVNMVIKSSLNITKAYYINEGNHLVIQHSMQSAINGLFFSKRTLKPSKFDLDFARETSVEEFNEKEYIKKHEYEFSPFVCVSNGSESMTDFEIEIEHYKLYYKEYKQNLDKTLIETIGKQGYGKYHNFLTNNNYMHLFDSAFINSKANYMLAWTNKEKRSLMEVNPFYVFNYKSLRNALGPYVLGHAFRLANHEPETPITTNYEPKVTMPSYNMWFLFADFVDSNGISAFDGQRVLTEKQKIAASLLETLKVAFGGLDKGIGRLTKDEVYFYHKGEKIYLNVTSPLNVASRENLGVLIEGMYNAQCYFKGIKTHKRDFDKDPLVDTGENNLFNELAPLQEVFVNGKSVGKHVVGLMTSYFVHNVDSSYKNEDLNELIKSSRPQFKKYMLGSEWFARLFLMGDIKITKYLLGTQKQIRDKINKLLEEGKGKLFTKKGSIIKKVFQREVIGYSSTVSANANLRLDEARLYLPDQEINIFLMAMYKIDKNFDMVKARENLDNGGFVILPPALQLRSPSIDDANTIFMNTYLYKTTSKFAKYGYIEVNPITWAIQGGDFDGDQAILIFFPYYLKKSLHDLFKVSHHEDLMLVQYENKIMEMSGLKYPEALAWQANQYHDLKSFLEFIAKVKEKTPMTLKQMSRKECIIAASSNALTTRVSKQLIGVSKSITMKPIFYIKDAIIFYGLQNDLELMNKLRKAADKMNRKLVQPSIDIQKWSDDLNSVVELTEIVNRMSDAVSYCVESHFYPTKYNYWETIYALIELKYLSKTFDGIKVQAEQPDKIDGTIMKPYFNTFLNKSDLDIYFSRKPGFNVEGYDIENAGWSEKTNPKEFVESLIEIINVDGEIYKEVEASVKEEMKDFNANEEFFKIKGGEK